MTDKLPGQTIRGYTIQEEIGAGGFATVYRAHQVAIDRDVAIKVIHPQYVKDSESAQRFEHEAKIVARLEHFNIVPVYDYWFSEEAGACMVMRYLEGSSLKQHIEEHGRLALPETAQIISQVCEALHFAHERDVVHRDMKPGNILLDNDGNAFVTDFGVAKALTVEEMHLTKTGDVVGTPAYFAPEQATSGEFDGRLDIYSLGLVLFECLTGQYPFPGQPFQHLTQPLPPVRELVPSLPEAIDAVIATATAHNLDERYSGALAFSDALQEVSAAYEAGDIGGAPDEDSLPEQFVFLSYDDADTERVQAIEEHLNLMGVETETLAHQPDNPDYEDHRQALLLASTEGVVILSETAATSPRTRSDWRAILSQDKRLYTLLVDDIGDDAMPFRLQLTPIFDLTDGNKDDTLNTLAQTIVSDRMDERRQQETEGDLEALHLLAQSATLARQVADVPKHIRQIVGRDAIQAQIEDDLVRFGRVLLQGLGGIGKTTLAAEIAAHYLEKQAGSDTDSVQPVLWLKVGDEEAAIILQALLKPLLENPEDFSGNTASIGRTLRDTLIEKEVGLLVLDDVWSEGAELKQVMDALPDEIQVLLTSRERYPVGKIVDVNVLPVEAAVELINLHAYTDYSADDEDVVALCDALGRHTLALEIAGKTMQVDNLSPQAMLKVIEDAPHSIAMPYGFAEEGRESVKNLLDASISVLDDATSEVFFTFGALPNPAATPGLIALCLGQPRVQINAPLSNLTQRGLINHTPDDDATRYQLHELAHAYARTNRQLGKYRAVEAARQYVEQHQDDLNALDAERSNLLLLAQTAHSIGRVDDFIAIVYTLAVDSDYLKARGHDALFLRQLDSAIAVMRNLDEKERLHYLLGKRADAHFERGQHEEAIEAYTESVALAEELDMPERQVIVMCAMSRPFLHRENFQRSFAILDNAEKIAEDYDEELLLRVLTNKARLEHSRENFTQMKNLVTRAANIAENLNQPEHKFKSYYNLAGVNIYLENSDEAEDSLNKAMKVAQEAKNKIWMAETYLSLGFVFQQKNKDAVSKTHYQQARKLFSESGLKSKVEEVETRMREAGYEIKQ